MQLLLLPRWQIRVACSAGSFARHAIVTAYGIPHASWKRRIMQCCALARAARRHSLERGLGCVVLADRHEQESILLLHQRKVVVRVDPWLRRDLQLRALRPSQAEAGWGPVVQQQLCPHVSSRRRQGLNTCMECEWDGASARIHPLVCTDARLAAIRASFQVCHVHGVVGEAHAGLLSSFLTSLLGFCCSFFRLQLALGCVLLAASVSSFKLHSALACKTRVASSASNLHSVHTHHATASLLCPVLRAPGPHWLPWKASLLQALGS
jgi:hypothetical protein